jgi:hypothetical protein
MRMALVCRDNRPKLSVLAYKSHEPVLYSCGKHHLQGVWGQQAHPAGAEPARKATHWDVSYARW